MQRPGPCRDLVLQAADYCRVGDAGTALGCEQLPDGGIGSRPPTIPARGPPRAAWCRRRGRNSTRSAGSSRPRRASRPGQWWSNRRNAHGAARSIARDGRSCQASDTAAATPRLLKAAPRARRSAAAWSAACIMPKQSRITSASAVPSTGRRPRAASSPSQEPPCGLPYSATLRVPAAAGQRPRPGAPRLPPARQVRRARRPWAPQARWVGEQLGQSACRAEPHLQRVNRIGSWLVILREVVTRWLLAQIEHQIAQPARGRPGIRA